MQALKTGGRRDHSGNNVDSVAFQSGSELDGICRGDGGDLNMSGRAEGIFGRDSHSSTSTGDKSLEQGVVSTSRGVNEGPVRPSGSYRGFQWVQGAGPRIFKAFSGEKGG